MTIVIRKGDYSHSNKTQKCNEVIVADEVNPDRQAIIKLSYLLYYWKLRPLTKIITEKFL